MHKIIVAAGSAFLLTSCSLTITDYQRGDLPAVESYAQAEKYVGPAIGAKFWEEFQDQKLNFIVEKALLNNYSLRVSAVNVEKALLNVDLSATDRHPTATASLGVQTQRALDYHQSMQKTSSLNLVLSYQADLFGKIEAENLSSYESYKATAYDYLAMRLTVIESVCIAYWQYAYAKEALELGFKDLDDSNRSLQLVIDKYNAGAADILDLDNARIDNLKVVSELDLRKANLARARTALGILLGATPDKDFDIDSLDKAIIPNFSLDLPSALLARRPDLMEYESLLRQAYADSDAKRLAFFPDFTLSAGFGSGGVNTLGRFLADPIGTLAGAVTLPFLNFNRLNIERKSALKDIEIAELNFTSAYINAVKEVYDGVVNVENYRKDVMNYRQAYLLTTENYNRYRFRYQEGLVSLTDYLDAAAAMRSAEISYLQSKFNNLEATVALMSALGGDTYLQPIQQ